MPKPSKTEDLLRSGALSRENWISARHFHDVTETEVLREVARRVSELKARVRADSAAPKTAHPLVLLDLDSTLYKVEPRNLRIFLEWAGSEEGARFPAVAAALKALSEDQIGYSVADSLRTLGLD